MNKQIKKQIYAILILVLLLTQIQSRDNPFYTLPNGEPRKQRERFALKPLKSKNLKNKKTNPPQLQINCQNPFSQKTIHHAEMSFAVFKTFFALF